MEITKVVKSKWGSKRLCPSCGIRFYDLNKNPIICPDCSTEILPETSKGRKPIATKELPKPATLNAQESEGLSEEVLTEALNIEDVEDIGDDDSDDDTLIEDTSDLDQGDDVSEVKDHIEGGSKEEV